MDWKPNKLIAILLGFLIQPLGMLYIVRIKLAFIYFIFGIIAGVTDFWLGSEIQYISFVFILMIICTVHIYYLLRNYEPIKNRPLFSHWYVLISFLMIALTIIFFFRSFLYEPFKIPSTSMSPTLNTGDIIIISKWGYGNYGTLGYSFTKTNITKKLKRGDVIVFEYPKNSSIKYVKRIIGISGDIIDYSKGFLSINNKEVLKEFKEKNSEYNLYIEHLDEVSYNIKMIPNNSAKSGSVIVPNKHIFIMGDNRDRSNDSRYFGFIPIKNIIGKVIYAF